MFKIYIKLAGTIVLLTGLITVLYLGQKFEKEREVKFAPYKVNTNK